MNKTIPSLWWETKNGSTTFIQNISGYLKNEFWFKSKYVHSPELHIFSKDWHIGIEIIVDGLFMMLPELDLYWERLPS